MAATVWWALGFILLAVEMATNTFYLLILGFTALTTGCAAWFDLPPAGQWIMAAVVATVGSIAVNRYRRSHPMRPNPMQDLDLGQPVRPIRRDGVDLRVQYRGAEWAARLLTPADALPDTLYIHGKQGNCLLVDTRPPQT